VGHGVHSALTATLCVSGLRNARRRGGTLIEQAEAANEALMENSADRAAFVTGIVGRLDLRTGILAVVNAGHPAPLLVRDGTAQFVALPVNRPFGLLRDRPFRHSVLALRPGDRLVMLTDGMLERGAAALDLPARLQHLSALHPRELVRVLGDLVLDVVGALADDACLLVLDWHGGHGDTRRTDAGADPDRATSQLGSRPGWRSRAGTAQLRRTTRRSCPRGSPPPTPTGRSGRWSAAPRPVAESGSAPPSC
jgi:hypothetical protein